MVRKMQEEEPYQQIFWTPDEPLLAPGKITRFSPTKLSIHHIDDIKEIK
jgi:hypothetical protein